MADPVPGDNDEPVGPHPADRRSAALAAIESARTDDLREAGMDIPEPEPAADPPINPEPALAPPEASSEDDKPPAPETGSGTPPEEKPGPEATSDTPEPTYKVMVDGQEKEIKLSELTRSYQINGAAEQRLGMASDVLKRVEKIQEDLKAGKTEDEPEGGKPAGEPPKAPLEGIDFKAVAEQLQYSSPEEAAEALKGLVTQVLEETGTGAAGPDRAEVTRAVMDEVDFRNAVSRFGQDYSDIAGDLQLSQIAGNRSHQIYESYQKWSQETGNQMPDYWSIMKMAGDDTRTWAKDTLGKLTAPLDSGDPSQDDLPNPDTTTPSAKDARLERKRSATQPPRAQGTPAPDRPKANPKEKSEVDKRRDAIKEMADSRGQSL